MIAVINAPIHQSGSGVFYLPRKTWLQGFFNYVRCLDMKYITNILAIILAIGLFINPLSLLAEDAFDLASSTASDSNESAVASVVAAVLTASITAPANNAQIQIDTVT